jgi:cadmium resistance protein CadD (predicted permease)
VLIVDKLDDEVGILKVNIIIETMTKTHIAKIPHVWEVLIKYPEIIPMF